MKGIAGSWLAGLAVGVAVAASAAGGDAPALRTRETFRRTFFVRGADRLREVGVREELSLRAFLRIPGLGPAGLDAATPVGLRVGGEVFETVLGSDPRWTPGSRRARLPLPGRGVLRLRWSGGDLHVEARLPGRAPYAAARASDPAGTIGGALDAAFRLGESSFRFAGTLGGDVRHRTVPILGEPVDLPGVRLDGSGRILPLTEDAAAPAVAVAAPADGRLVPPGTVSVEGSLRDDRVVDRVTVSVDGAPEVDVPFVRDPATGYLDDFLGTFSVPVEAAGGSHQVEIRAYDAAGNAGLASVSFFAGTPATRAFDAGDAEGSAGPGFAVIDAGGQVRRHVNGGAVVPGLQGTVAVAATPTGLLALQPDGTILALGVNARGFLGDGTTTNSAIPVPVAGITGASDVAAAGETGIALFPDGSVWTWGDGRYGNLGNGAYTPAPRTTAAKVEGIPPMRAVAGHVYGVVAVDVDGFVWTWGISPSPLVPTKVQGPAGIVSVAASTFGDFILALDGTGQVWSWGNNGYGQCGRAGNASVPAVVPGIVGATAVACGRDHSLVLLADGTLLASGRDLYGTLGDGPATTPPGYLIPVPGFDQVVSVEAGFNTSLAMRADGTVWAWGAYNNRTSPTRVTGF